MFRFFRERVCKNTGLLQSNRYQVKDAIYLQPEILIVHDSEAYHLSDLTVDMLLSIL